jgi:ribosomal protein L29
MKLSDKKKIFESSEVELSKKALELKDVLNKEHLAKQNGTTKNTRASKFIKKQRAMILTAKRNIELSKER